MFVLSDEGTLDTVLYCSDCDEEQRYAFQPVAWETSHNELGGYTEATDDCGRTYNTFVTYMLTEANNEHECSS